jgi:hypothetical protein
VVTGDRTALRRNRRYFYLIAAAVLLWGAIGVRRAPAGEEWLPIAPEDLALKDNPANPGADAMILYRENEILTSDSAIDEYVRVKIFTQEGLKYGDVQINYQKGFAEIQNLRARTIRPNGEVINWDGKVYDGTAVKYRD